MRRCTVILLVVLLTIMPAASLDKDLPPVASATAEEKPLEAQKRGKPNVLFIMTDDQAPDTVRHMRHLQRLLVDKGTNFTNSYVTTPHCCPSRATMLRGQYAHNHKIRNNKLPDGGAIKFRRKGLDHSTVATWMNRAGYDTAYIGKYLNEYDSRYVPPGWDRWYGSMGNYGAKPYDKYSINVNGKRRIYDRRRIHDTDFMAKKATNFIKAHRNSKTPWFMVVAPNAPHSPSYAAKRHRKAYRKARLPRVPSFNEKDVRDKPNRIRNKPRYSRAGVRDIKQKRRQRLRSLKSVDEMIKKTVATLGRTGQLRNTYIVYTTDNGYMLGKHRMDTKGVPYEEAINVPLIVRGPGVARNVSRGQLVSSTDWAPTISDWGSAKTPRFVDGRSLKPLLTKNTPPDWRNSLLIEYWHGHSFSGLLTTSGTRYVEYDTGEKELYDLRKDPYQLENTARQASPETLKPLSEKLDALKKCARKSCRAAENTSP